MLRKYGTISSSQLLWAAVTFRRPLAEAELNKLLEQYGFTRVYFEFVASNGILGGYSTKVAKSLADAAKQLETTSPRTQIQGIVYVVGYAEGPQLVRFDTDEQDIVLVDIGPDDMNARRAKGERVNMVPPPNLYYWHKKFTTDPSPELTPTPPPSYP